MRNYCRFILQPIFAAFYFSCSTHPIQTNTYTVSGNVHISGKPVSNATISIKGYDYLTAQSGVAGEFKIQNVPTGQQIIIIEKQNDDSSFVQFSQSILVENDTVLAALALPVPVHLHPVIISDKTKCNLTWTASVAEDFREYKIFRHPTSGLDESTGELIHVTTSSSDTLFTDTFTVPDTYYFYRVFVMNAFGRIGGSNIQSIRTQTLYDSGSLKLVQSRVIGVPLANPVGIASDQKNMWVMFGAHNDSVHTLIYYDISTFTTVKSYSYSNLIETLGTGVYGLTWDGTSVWISVSGNTNKLVKVETDSGHIVRTWSSPTTLGPSDLEWDGKSIWISSGTGKILTMDAQNGGSTLFAQLNFRDRGIAVRPNEVWVGDLFATDIHVLDIKDGHELQCMKNAIAAEGCFCFHQGQLAVLTGAGITFYDIVE